MSTYRSPEALMDILGYEPNSPMAEEAQTWVNATLDDDELWFDDKTDEEIVAAFEKWYYDSH